MPNILAGSLNGKFGVKPARSLAVLSLVVNNRCNLNCRHCYFQVERETRQMTTDEWLQLLDSAYRKLEPTTVTFAGREIFAEPQSAELFISAIRLLRQQRPKRRTEIGVITNATLLEPYREQLLTHPPDYFDVSVDGLQAQHDAIRGAGAWDQVALQLHWLQDQFGSVWLTPTLNSANLSALPEMISFYRKEFGVRRFSVGFYVPMVYTDLDLGLSIKDFHFFTDDILIALEQLKGVSDVEIVIELDENQKHLIRYLQAAGYLKNGGDIYSEDFLLDNGLNLTFNIARIPVGLWRSVRISANGGWIAAEDMLRVNEYDRLAVAWASDMNYDAEKLYQAGLASARLTELIRSYPMVQNYLAKPKESPAPGPVHQAIA
jgi:MoaA/NifB/PqqE/SkfB family radical SAM enzyme